MQKDLLTELHLAKLDFKSIQSIVAQNSNKLAYLFRESTDYVKKIKTVPPHLKGVVKSMVSDCVEINSSLPRKNAKVVKKKFILKKSLISSDKSFKNGLKNLSSLPPTPTKISTVVSNALQESNTENNGKCKCKEINSFPTKCYSNSKILRNVTEFNINTSAAVAELNSITKAEPVKDLVSSSFSEEKPLDNNLNQSLASDSILINSDVDILKRKSSSNSPTEGTINCSVVGDVKQQFEPNFDLEKRSEPALCVISEIVGNATDNFSVSDDPEEIIEEEPEIQLIFPKKTNDITKIKGWRRKQFFVEKPTTIEFFSIAQKSLPLQKKFKLNKCNDIVEKTNSEEPGDAKNAFVCDSLDEFLDRDAELKIGFEIPHLFAEFGIKLTRNEIVSRPNLSEKDIKEVETRYCVPIPSPWENTKVDGVKEEGLKRVKRPIEYYQKPCKLLKVEENKRNSVRLAQKMTDNLNVESNEKHEESKSSPENFKRNKSNRTLSNIKLVNKFIALVVYPGPYVPLHPIVQFHLAKIRSYRTKVDENWANFAASAVLVNNKRYERRILPVQCCVKIVTTPIETNDFESSVTSEVEDDIEIKNLNKKQFKLKKCSVVVEKLDSLQICDPWCMVHNCYNCTQCGLDKSKFKERKVQEFIKEAKSQDEELRETVTVSPRATFDKTIATLLAKKVRLLKYNGDTLTSIDCLKTLTPNTVEFIKLKFVKESLLTGYINIWYMKPEKPEVRSRAFLTFSKTSPVPNAVNLKSSDAPPLNHLPKVIAEIISEENTFDANEYAILHCNGEIWEIHGSLNIAFGKNDKNVEQIFTSIELPELKELQEIAFDILQVNIVKWWVLDLTQKFRLIEFKSESFSTIVIRKKLTEVIAMNLFGFLPLSKDPNNRVLGAYIFQQFLPFILIGPYYLLETHDLILKGESATVPFTYYGENNITTNCPLKYFVNSVIKNVEQNYKKLEGLWLYDKMNLDGTSYLEVVTKDLGGPLPNKYSSIDIEHGYSLSSLTSSSILGATSGIIKRKNGKVEFKKVTVYLYFDVFELGFVEGELQYDNSVIISHPLEQQTKMKSHKAGDWFIDIIKRRIEFVPKNLVVKWFITKHKDDLGNRRPFNKFFLGGAHILTNKGIYYLLEMSESRIKKLGLNESEIFKALAEGEVMQEVKELKNLADLLVNDSYKSLSIDEVLTKAIDEIKKLKYSAKILKCKKNMAQKKKINTMFYFLEMLNMSRIPFRIKMKMFERLEFSFKKQNGNLNEDFVKKLKISRIGRRYLKQFEKSGNNHLKKIKEKTLNVALRTDAKKRSILKSERLPVFIQSLSSRNPVAKNQKKKKNIQNCKKPSATLLKASNNAIQTKADCPKYAEFHLQTDKLNSISDQRRTFKKIYPKVIKNSGCDKERMEENFEKKEIKNNEFVLQKLPNNMANSDEFVRLTSPEISDSLRSCWKKLVC